MKQLYGHRSEIYTLKFYNLNYKILISGSNDSTIRIWNIITGEQLVLFGGPQGAKGYTFIRHKLCGSIFSKW